LQTRPQPTIAFPNLVNSAGILARVDMPPGVFINLRLRASEMAEFRSFLADTLGAAARVSRDGAVHFVCMDWRHMDDVSAVGRTVGAPQSKTPGFRVF